MGMQLPAWVRQMFLVVTGDGWPEADEDALWALARAWVGIGDTVDEQRQKLADLTLATRATRRTDWDGPAAEAYAVAGAGLGGGGPLAAMASAAYAVAAFVYGTGVNVQYMKIIVLEELVLLAAQIAQLVAAAPATGGASLPTVAALQRLGQLYARLMQSKLIQTIMVLAVGEAMQLALDAFAQAAQLAAGTRHRWDTDLTENAAIVGAIGGALGLAGQGALAGLMKAAKVSPTLSGYLQHRTGTLSDAERILHRRSVIGQSFAQVPVGAAHEYLTSGVTGAVTGQGWIGTPWDATAGATEGVVDGLSRLKRNLHPAMPLVEFRALPGVEVPAASLDQGNHGPSPAGVPPTGSTGTGGEQTTSRAPAPSPAQSRPGAPTSSPEAPAPPTRRHSDQQPVPQHHDQQPVPQRIGQQHAAETPPPHQPDSPGLVVQQPARLAAVPPARDGAGLAACLRGQDEPHRQPVTPVENDQRHDDPPPVRRNTAGNQQPVRPLGTPAPQTSTAPTTQPSHAADGPVRRLRIDATQTQPDPAHTVVTPAPQTQHVEMFEITPDGAVHHVNRSDGESAVVPPATTPAQLPHPDNAASTEHLGQPPSPTAQPDPASPTHLAQPPAAHGSLFPTAIRTLTVDSTIAEDRAAVRDYTSHAYRQLNRYLRDPVGFTELLRQKVTVKIDAQIQAKNLRVSAGRREQTISARTRARAAGIQARSDRLSEALHRMPPTPSRTYRRVRYSEEVLARYKPRDLVTEAAFTSTSRHLLPLAHPISNGENDVVFIVVGDNGRDISHLARYPAEKEVLYDKGTRFRVISKIWEGDCWWIVMREEVPTSQAANPGGSPVGVRPT